MVLLLIEVGINSPLVPAPLGEIGKRAVGGQERARSRDLSWCTITTRIGNIRNMGRTRGLRGGSVHHRRLLDCSQPEYYEEQPRVVY